MILRTACNLLRKKVKDSQERKRKYVCLTAPSVMFKLLLYKDQLSLIMILVFDDDLVKVVLLCVIQMMEAVLY